MICSGEKKVAKAANATHYIYMNSFLDQDYGKRWKEKEEQEEKERLTLELQQE